jgi:uncharacterized membrane protein YdcZ (DUF606 family)
MILAAGFVAKEFESVSGQLLHYNSTLLTYFSLVSSCSGDMILVVVVVNVVTFSRFSLSTNQKKNYKTKKKRRERET